jgi:hypothetical protein
MQTGAHLDRHVAVDLDGDIRKHNSSFTPADATEAFDKAFAASKHNFTCGDEANEPEARKTLAGQTDMDSTGKRQPPRFRTQSAPKPC